MSTTYFTEGKLLPYEALMRLMPNQKPRYSGFKVRDYGAEDYDCDFCAHRLGRKKSCPNGICPYYAERIRHGYVSYGEVLLNIADKFGVIEFTKRIKKLIGEKEQTNMFFADFEHKRRYAYLKKTGVLTHRSSAAFASALFLLTANDCIWRRSKHAVTEEWIKFNQIDISGLSLFECGNYALYKAAKEMYSGNREITVSELSDEYVVSDNMLRLIVNSFAIRRYGLKVVKI